MNYKEKEIAIEKLEKVLIDLKELARINLSIIKPKSKMALPDGEEKVKKNN